MPTDIPLELLALWNKRDRQGIEQRPKPDTVSHDPEILLDDWDENFRSPPQTPPNPLLTEIRPIAEHKLFPQYRMTPSPISLAKFHADTGKP